MGITAAYPEKAFNLPQLEPKSGAPLSPQELERKNIMEDVDYMEELDNPTSMAINKWRVVLFKSQVARTCVFSES